MREERQIEFRMAVVEVRVPQTKEKVEEGDWRRTSLQASEEERRVDKVGKIDLSDVRANKCNLTKLNLLWLLRLILN